MTELLLDCSAAALPLAPPHDIVRDALLESRQHWRHLVSLAADLVFETDAKGRFVFIVPDNALGWPADSLIGQPSELLAGTDATGAAFNPFRPTVEVRKHRARLRHADGRLTMMTISSSPLYDPAGHRIGAHGVGIGLAGYDAQTSCLADQVRRGEVLDHILLCIGQETDTDGMMDVALGALIDALGAEGSAVIGTVPGEAEMDVLHECGPGASGVLTAAAQLVARRKSEPSLSMTLDGRLVLAVGCQTRFSADAALAIWRGANGRAWNQEDTALAASGAGIVSMILEYEALKRETAYLVRIDPLTGLLNRRAFVEEMRRQAAWMERESGAGTLLFAGVDSLQTVNECLGHAAGDQVLVYFADMLRRLVRPFDLVARIDGDEFAIWMNGADHMTVAERADYLCRAAPEELQSMLPQAFADLGVSVGIATRRAGSQESIEDLTRRGEMAMHEVKRNGRRHWRVSLLDGD